MFVLAGLIGQAWGLVLDLTYLDYSVLLPLYPSLFSFSPGMVGGGFYPVQLFPLIFISPCVGQGEIEKALFIWQPPGGYGCWFVFPRCNIPFVEYRFIH